VTPWVGQVSAIAIVLFCGVSTPAPMPENGLPQTLWSNVPDYTTMWWMHGLRDERKVFAIQTSRLALAFDVPAFQLTHLTKLRNPPSEVVALTLKNEAVFGPSNASLVCSLRADESTYQATGASQDFTDSYLIESGKFFQRRTVNEIVWTRGAPIRESSLEIAAWPDRLTLWLCVTPQRAIAQGELAMVLAAADEFTVAAAPGDVKRDRVEGRSRWIARLVLENWSAGEERTLALILSLDASSEDETPTIRAEQMAPTRAPLDVTYDNVLGWFRVDLRNDVSRGEYTESGNDRIERVALTISNPATTARTVRLCFAKGLPRNDGVFGITGLSAMLRDTAGNPTGIPIQLSKNWHTKPGLYRGPWYRGLTMFTIPAGWTVQLEYTSVNALWGGVPAASHAQLCLVGWGSNQLWEESALGAWGETICYEPDQGQVGGAVLDTRPLMVSSFGKEPQKKWGWTANVGGADFLVYYDAQGRKQWNSRMKTLHRRQGPVLTEVSYAGQSHDGNIDLQYTVSLYRTDDLARGVYHFRYDIRKPTSFRRLVLFQCGGDDYSYTGERKFAFGNERGLVREWDTQWGGNRYKTEPFEATGRLPWFSMHEAVSRAQGCEAWANRGLVIRQWMARLGGQAATPWVAERGAKVRGADTSLIDILPPPAVQELGPGDFVEATIEHVIVPQFADDYYGPNQGLRAALQQNQNTWRMVSREALGNDLEIEISKGRLLRQRPTLIQAVENQAEFTIAGGLGFVPVTIAGLTDYREPILEVREGDVRKIVDQTVHGKDFWQCDMDPQTRTYQITYSIRSDTLDDKRVPRRYRFSCNSGGAESMSR
jgi:hypothetical protein